MSATSNVRSKSSKQSTRRLKADRKTHRMAFRCSDPDLAIIEHHAAASGLKLSDYLREVALGKAPRRPLIAPQRVTVPPGKAGNRTGVIAIRFRENEKVAVEKMARRFGYANAAAFIRARIFTSLEVRLAGELGAAVARIDGVLARGGVDAKMLRRALLSVKADLLAAGAVPRRPIEDPGAQGLVA